ncbi:MAG: hypothetical protein ACK5T1_03290, partial [Betaproteobacteria bacterium]
MRPTTGNKAESGGSILVMGRLHFWPQKKHGVVHLKDRAIYLDLLRPAFAKAAKGARHATSWLQPERAS